MERNRMSKTIYDYWRDKEGLVCFNYGRKVLGLNRDDFKQLVEDHQIKTEERKSPHGEWKVTLYDIYHIRRIKSQRTAKRKGHSQIKQLDPRIVEKIKRTEEWKLDRKLWDSMGPEQRRYLSLEETKKLFRVRKRNIGKQKKFKRLFAAIDYRNYLLE
jgi:hypothetical protein